MKLYETVFLELLKAGMWGRKPQVPQGFAEWTKVVMSAKSQSVLGVVAQVMLSDEDVASQLPQDMKARLKKWWYVLPPVTWVFWRAISIVWHLWAWAGLPSSPRARSVTLPASAV